MSVQHAIKYVTFTSCGDYCRSQRVYSVTAVRSDARESGLYANGAVARTAPVPIVPANHLANPKAAKTKFKDQNPRAM